MSVSERGRKHVLGQEAKEKIAQTIDGQPDITLAEIVENWNFQLVSKRYGVRFRQWSTGAKRRWSMLQNRSVPDVREKRKQWCGFASKAQTGHLVFLDESGVNVDMLRRYGRGRGGQRVVDHTPLNTPKSTTILSSIRLDGEMALTTFQGGTTGVKFLAYLKEVLIPTLRLGDIVVMDNLRTHHIQAVGELLRKAEVEVLYLPPYSPDLNPIEKMWSKVKAILRKLRIRTPDALEPAIRKAVACVSSSDCAAWFRCAGYCLF